jgi:hypothetical protein
MMPNRKIYSCLLVLLLCGLDAVAQTTYATITGLITDGSGAVLPNVTVTVTNIATGIETETKSNQAGVYTVTQLREGEYTLRANSPGFSEFAAENIILVARDNRRIDISLQVGAVTYVVDVTEGATLVETESARISDTKSKDVLKTLPVNSRQVWAFLQLSPNVLQGTNGIVRFAGSRMNQAAWAMDGTTVANGVEGVAIGPLFNFIESVEEVKVDVANNTAEFGAVGQVTAISKSGTNELHGSVFDYYATSWFRARNPFALERVSGVVHQPGGSLGGPVYLPKIYNGKNKTFFFFTLETSAGSRVTANSNTTMPLAAWREGDFSRVSTPVLDPTTNQQFPGNRIPANRINEVSKKIQERFYLLPNFGNPNVFTTLNYRTQRSRERDPNTLVSVRGDHRLSSADTLYGRFTWTRGYNNVFETLPTLGQRTQQRDTRAVSLSHTHVFSPTFVHEFRYGFAYNNNPFEGPVRGREIVQELGLVGLADDLPDIGGIFRVNWQGLGITPVEQTNHNIGFQNRLHEFQEHLNWYRGRHTVKAGFDLTRVGLNDGAAHNALFGLARFSNNGFTRHAYADFLLGMPTETARAFPFVVTEQRRWQADFFLQDDFKVNPQLTLNLGVRYEYHPMWRERNGRTSLFDINSGKIVVADGSTNLISPLLPRSYVDVMEASAAGLPGSTLVRSDKNNFLPRVGLAYRPWSNDTVLRGGFSIYYDIVPREITMGGVPYVINEPAYVNPRTDPIILPRVFPASGSGTPPDIGLPAAVNTDLRMPYSMQWNFTIEHSRWNTGFRLSYVATNTRQGEWIYNYNSPVPDSRPYVDKPRPFLRYPEIGYVTNGAGHQYHGFTAEAERRLAKGLHFQTSWAWARDIGDLERGGDDEVSENPFDRHRERAVWRDMPTHRISANWIYEFPFGKGRKYLGGANRSVDLLVGGWQLSGVYAYYSGQFLTPLWTGPDPTGTRHTQSRTPASVTLRPDHLRDANLPSDVRNLSRWYDVSAFDAPESGQFGTAAKGVIVGPHVNVWHMGVAKNFRLGEARPLFRWELTATNAFNHPNWNNPILSITTQPGAGTITGAGNVNASPTGDSPGPRAFRMGFRVEW